MATQPDFVNPLDGDTLFSVLWPDVNDNFKGCATCFYSDDDVAPATTYPGMIWIDAGTDDEVKVRNAADDGWIVLGKWVTGADGDPKWGGVGIDITAGAEAANVIAFTINVVSPDGGAGGSRIKGRRLVNVMIATSSFGAPTGTQTVAATTGVVIEEHATGQSLLCETDADGQLVLDVTVAGAATRYLRASCGDSEVEEQAATWT